MFAFASAVLVGIVAAILIWLLPSVRTYTRGVRQLSAFPRAPGLWPLLRLMDVNTRALRVPAEFCEAVNDSCVLVGPFADASPALLVNDPQVLARVFSQLRMYARWCPAAV